MPMRCNLFRLDPTLKSRVSGPLGPVTVFWCGLAYPGRKIFQYYVMKHNVPAHVYSVARFPLYPYPYAYPLSFLPEKHQYVA